MLNRVDRTALMSIAVLVAIIVVLTMARSGYQPRPIVIKPKTEKSIFDLETSLECTAGSGKEDSAYSKGLTPGGVCGAQEVVAQLAGYEIVDGVGGSLI